MGQSTSDAKLVELHQASAQHHLAVDRRHCPALSMRMTTKSPNTTTSHHPH
ncbi:hypothetical protein OG250_07790 [Streptomyces sp. NBC_00487]|uniref:hypothetical protein n=1 Tax=unclassified Streptomyces TaxID=2593676 RepID=UPI002E17BBD5|nr:MULTISPECIES: hypothetical protein [unclassified Streptomyces]